jgi:hypothetical protein
MLAFLVGALIVVIIYYIINQIYRQSQIDKAQALAAYNAHLNTQIRDTQVSKAHEALAKGYFSIVDGDNEHVTFYKLPLNPTIESVTSMISRIEETGRDNGYEIDLERQSKWFDQRMAESAESLKAELKTHQEALERYKSGKGDDLYRKAASIALQRDVLSAATLERIMSIDYRLASLLIQDLQRLAEELS